MRGSGTVPISQRIFVLKYSIKDDDSWSDLLSLPTTTHNTSKHLMAILHTILQEFSVTLSRQRLGGNGRLCDFVEEFGSLNDLLLKAYQGSVT